MPSFEIIDAVQRSLESDGILQSVRLQLRTSVLNVIANQSNKQRLGGGKTLEKLPPVDVDLMLALVLDVLDTMNLSKTRLVLLSEAGLEGQKTRDYLTKELKLSNTLTESSPVLSDLIESHRRNHRNGVAGGEIQPNDLVSFNRTENDSSTSFTHTSIDSKAQDNEKHADSDICAHESNIVSSNLIPSEPTVDSHSIATMISVRVESKNREQKSGGGFDVPGQEDGDSDEHRRQDSRKARVSRLVGNAVARSSTGWDIQSSPGESDTNDWSNSDNFPSKATTVGDVHTHTFDSDRSVLQDLTGKSTLVNGSNMQTEFATSNEEYLDDYGDDNFEEDDDGHSGSAPSITEEVDSFDHQSSSDEAAPTIPPTGTTTTSMFRTRSGILPSAQGSQDKLVLSSSFAGDDEDSVASEDLNTMSVGGNDSDSEDISF